MNRKLSINALKRNLLSAFMGLLYMPLAGLHAQQNGQISVDSQVDKSTINIGDLISYRVMVTHSEDVQVMWPSLASNLGAFEIRDYQVKEPRQQDGLIVEETEYTISTFDTGAYIIPPVILEYALSASDSSLEQIQTEPLEIYVKSLLPSEEGDIRGLKPQVELPRDWRIIALYGALGLLALLIIAALIWHFKFRKKGESFFSKPAPPPRPPHEIAFERLRALEQAALFEKGEVKTYYSELSDIFRHYLAGIFGFDAMEKTTFEIVDHLAGKRQAHPHATLLQETLDICDLAKFAKYQSSREESVAAMAKVYDYVKATKPPPATEEPATGIAAAGNGDSSVPVKTKMQEATTE